MQAGKYEDVFCLKTEAFYFESARGAETSCVHVRTSLKSRRDPASPEHEQAADWLTDVNIHRTSNMK